MGRWKLSILTCLAVIGGFALVFAAMRGANPVWAGVVGSITFFLLTASLLGIGYGRGTTRAFWVGFATLGWAYMALTTIPWFAVKVSSVLSIPLFDVIFPTLHPESAERAMGFPFGGGIRGGGIPPGMGDMGGMGGGFRSVAGGGGKAAAPPTPPPTSDLASFRTIGRNLEALLWAVLGGWIARSFRAKRAEPVGAVGTTQLPS